MRAILGAEEHRLRGRGDRRARARRRRLAARRPVAARSGDRARRRQRASRPTCTRCSARSSARRCARCSTALVAGDGAALLDEIERIASSRPISRRCSMSSPRSCIASSCMQLVPAAAGEDDAALPGSRAGSSAEDVQLWYQMAVAGRRDLALAPTPRVGFEMTLLRMLAFRAGRHRHRADDALVRARCGTEADARARRSGRTAAARAGALAREAKIRSGAEATRDPDDAGQRREPLADDRRLGRADPPRRARRPARSVRAADDARRDRRRARAARAQTCSRASRAPARSSRSSSRSSAARSAARSRSSSSATVGGAESPAEQQTRTDSTRRQAAEDSLRSDPFVQSLEQTFGARVIANSVRPVDGEAR